MALRDRLGNRVVGAQINILVSLDVIPERGIERVEDALRSAGMRIEAKFPIAGTIAGIAAAKDLPRIRQIEGVVSVEEEPTFTAS